ncbi:Histone acetyltransferase kat7 [Xenotaenia resolanae]|uniref:Histone acetyltransferase kat7 n=1 Tax=Xenotaenia resolanae TaxID=208358 RepID=A0ABV0WL36_9TELE
MLLFQTNYWWIWDLHALLTCPADAKQGADQDETPPRTPTGNAPSSESDIEASSPSNDHLSSSNNIAVSQEEDERLAKELSLKEAAAHDLSHRPKRRRFHESYNFNMKCPTPGCNSLGHLTGRHERHFSISGCPLYHNLSADECKVPAHSNLQGFQMKKCVWNYEKIVT